MPNYRRVREGNTFFFTVVTYGRQKLLCLEESRAALGEIIKETQARMGFAIDAWVLMPDHLHYMWNKASMQRIGGGGQCPPYNAYMQHLTN